MAHINLLPWREWERARRKKQFFSMAGLAAGLMVMVVVYVHIHISGMIDYQGQRNRFLEQEISQVKAKNREIDELEKKKEQLVARMRIIERLQRNRPEVVHLFEEIVKTTPEGLYLDKIEQQAGMLTITGGAESNARVSSFMRQLDESTWFSDPSLDVIQVGSKGAERTRIFVLKVRQISPEGE